MRLSLIRLHTIPYDIFRTKEKALTPHPDLPKLSPQPSRILSLHLWILNINMPGTPHSSSFLPFSPDDQSWWRHSLSPLSLKAVRRYTSLHHQHPDPCLARPNCRPFVIVLELCRSHQHESVVFRRSFSKMTLMVRPVLRGGGQVVEA